MCDEQRLRSACAYTQSDQSLCLSLEYSMRVKLLTEHHLEFVSLKGGCTGSPESTCQNATLLEITCHCSFMIRTHTVNNSKSSEYDQIKPQSHTADQPTAPSRRVTENKQSQSQDNRKTIKIKQPALSSPSR